MPMLLAGIARVNTEKVWRTADLTSTVYRGERWHVVDCVKACLAHVYDPNVHLVMEASFSKGCPGDSQDALPHPVDATLMNNVTTHFKVFCKFSFYPLGQANYMNLIAEIVNLAIKRNLYQGSAHYVSFLEGDVQEVFSYVNEVLAYAEAHAPHYVFQITLSMNSPTPHT